MRPTKRFLSFNENQKHALDTGRNLAVRANAGSGKTSVLVERIVQLLAASWDTGAPRKLTELVAITFTRKAAAELQDRLRQAFAEQIATATDPGEQAFWASRIDELPGSMIGTIDSFCGRIVREFGWLDGGVRHIEPDFGLMEGYDEEILKREAIDRVINRLGALMPEGKEGKLVQQIAAHQWWAKSQGYYQLTQHLLALLSHVVDADRIVAAHRDLPRAQERVDALWPEQPLVKLWNQQRAALAETLHEMLHAIDAAEKRTKTLEDTREEIGLVLADIDPIMPEQQARAIESLRCLLFTQKGDRKSTRGLQVVETEFAALQDAWASLAEQQLLDFEGECAALEAADHLACLLEPVHAEYLSLCREANTYDFLTVARHTRDLLAHSRPVRQALRQRWRYLMVDEFQDTNGLQWEIFSWLVGDGPDGSLDADRLFIVGDPQQSIYRFRNADVSVFRRVEALIRANNGRHGSAARPTNYEATATRTPADANQRLGLMPLRENYRSLDPVPLALMDQVFAHAFDPAAQRIDLENDTFEVRYQPLVAGLKPRPGATGEVRYLLVPDADAEEEDETPVEAEAEDAPAGEPAESLARAQVELVADQLVEFFGQPKYTAKPGERQTLTWRDMTILLPSRSAVLTELERALRERRVPFSVTKGIGFWQRQEVRDAMSLASYLAGPGDELALFAVLRGPLGRLTDTAILYLSQRGFGSLRRGLWLLDKSSDKPLDSGLQEALEVVWQVLSEEERAGMTRIAQLLGTWCRRVDRMAHADLLQRCLEESGAYAIYAAEPQANVILANLERVLDVVRGLEHDSAPSLAHLTRRLRGQVDESLREEQANLAEQDAVQIMTVHAAKGLQFPVVAVMKMERMTDRGSYSGLRVVNDSDRLPDGTAGLPSRMPGTIAVRIRHPLRPREVYSASLLKALHQLDRAQQLAESRRLFYVAGTRAQERLILAGRWLKPNKNGERKKMQCWQWWFEDALGIKESHKSAGLWEDPERGWRVAIITQTTGAQAEPPPVLAFSPQPLVLEYIREPPRSPGLATTSLEEMRRSFAKNPEEWWLTYRAHVRPFVPAQPQEKAPVTPHSGRTNLGTVIGTLAHRLLEMGGLFLQEPSEVPESLLRAMAASLLNAGQDQSTTAEEENDVISTGEVDEVVTALGNLRRRFLERPAQAKSILDLANAPGEAEVPFALSIGRWHIAGRYDKLLDRGDGYEILDWKTDVDEPSKLVERYRPQMRLYALALLRSGKASARGDGLRVHLALLHHLRVEQLVFKKSELEAFAEELRAELEAMDAYAAKHA
jgi:ATP-dependent helicase/nuclease subunit A